MPHGAVNARTHEPNKFATYSSSGPGGAGSKLTIHVGKSEGAASGVNAGATTSGGKSGP